FGALFYFVAGINRIRHTRVSQQRDETRQVYASHRQAPIDNVVPYSGMQFASLRKLGDQISQFPVVGDNSIAPLSGGDEAYPAMMQAIREARHCIARQSYIFDSHAIGREMAQALIEAHERGVQVRVLIDAIGSKSSRTPIVR